MRFPSDTHTIRLTIELLEDRRVPAVLNPTPLIVAGDPIGNPNDSPAQRVDENTADSPFAGVGSLSIHTTRGDGLCSAIAIGPRHVLTAGHCVDLNNDGRSNDRDGIIDITFNVNAGDLSDQIRVDSWALHPDFSGFNKPALNDDLAVLTLERDLPIGVPFYDLAADPIVEGTELTLVGYGWSGDGVNGYTVPPDPQVKRVGANAADLFDGQDDRKRPAANEVFFFDFDGGTAPSFLGGPTLGNDRETTIGPGDSGGASFVEVNGELKIAGVNTFGFRFSPFTPPPPLFGSGGGGILTYPYRDWITAVVNGTDDGGGNGGNGGGNGGGKGKSSAVFIDATEAVAGLVSTQESNYQFIASTEVDREPIEGESSVLLAPGDDGDTEDPASGTAFDRTNDSTEPIDPDFAEWTDSISIRV